MRLTPRADEVEQVVAILESGEYEGPQAMAKALIKEVAEILAMRDWWALAHSWDDGASGMNFGPFASEADAKGLAAKLACGGTAVNVKLHSAGQIVAQVDSKKGAKDFCQDPRCGHAGWSHLMDGTTRGRCALDACSCRGWSK